MAADQVLTVRGDTELVARAGHLFTGARVEFVCVARDLDTWAQPEARLAIGDRMRAAHDRSFTVRKLLSPSALADEAARAHLRMVADNGAQVRISTTRLPHETILIDKRVMILAESDGPGEREFTVTTSPRSSAAYMRCSRRPGRAPPSFLPISPAMSRSSTPTA